MELVNDPSVVAQLEKHIRTIYATPLTPPDIPDIEPDDWDGLLNAIALIAAAAEEHGEPGTSDRGWVNPAIPAALTAMAADLGYQVRDEPGLIPLGISRGAPCSPGVKWQMQMRGIDGKGYDGPPFTIGLQAGMSPASRTRVHMHELAHVILGHPERTTAAHDARCIEAMKCMDDPELDAIVMNRKNWKEVAVELAAGAVCAQAGIGTGKFSRHYVSKDNYGDGGKLPGSTYRAASLAARALWAAIEPAVSYTAAA